MAHPAAAHDEAFAAAVRLRRRNLPVRFGVGAMGVLVFAPIIGVEYALAWALVYFLLQFGDAWVFAPVNSDDARPLPGWRMTLGCLSILASSAAYGFFTVPLWLAGGLAGGVCAVLILAGGMISTLMVAGRSVLMLGLCLAPMAAYLAGTPLLMLAQGAERPEAVAATVICFTFLAFAIAAFKVNARLVESEMNARQDLDRRRQEAEAAVAGKSAFAATICHDLRTPLSAILTGADTLERQAGDAASRENAALIGEAGRMMKTLLDHLLDHAKLEAGRMSVERETFNLRQVLARTIRLWQREAAGQGLRLRLEGAAALPAWVEGDPVRLRQILNNLISNALKFTQDGAVTIRARAWDDGAGEAAVLLEVIDTGPGMDADQLARLFTPFDQTEDGVSARHGGTGLGLAISRDLAQLMGGRLTARSAKGQGAAFTLALTLRRAAAPDAPAPSVLEARDRQAQSRPLGRFPGRSPGRSPGRPVSRPVPVPDGLLGRAAAPDAPVMAIPPDPAPVAPAPETVPETVPEIALEIAPPSVEPEAGETAERALRVLVVDDHEINRRAVQLILTPLGAEIATAADGMAALEAAGREAYDVIFMDVRMPELDGRETTRRLRAGDGPNRATPIIAVTADTAQDDIDACMAAGMDYFVSKPLTPVMLLGALNHVLQGAAAARAEPEAALSA